MAEEIELCGEIGPFGITCYRPKGHDGKHAGCKNLVSDDRVTGILGNEWPNEQADEPTEVEA